MTLTEFLLARIAEDDVEVDALLGETGRLADGRRLEAECEAKRRIMEDATAHETCGGGYDECAEASGLTLRHLAAIYAAHPDYRPEWKP